jgi:hypothetical protein
MSLLIRVLGILLTIAFVVLIYFVTVWVLAMLGIHIPDHILKVIFVIIGLMAAIAALTGRADNWFRLP